MKVTQRQHLIIEPIEARRGQNLVEEAQMNIKTRRTLAKENQMKISSLRGRPNEAEMMPEQTGSTLGAALSMRIH